MLSHHKEWLHLLIRYSWAIGIAQSLEPHLFPFGTLFLCPFFLTFLKIFLFVGFFPYVCKPVFAKVFCSQNENTTANNNLSFYSSKILALLVAIRLHQLEHLHIILNILLKSWTSLFFLSFSTRWLHVNSNWIPLMMPGVTRGLWGSRPLS